MQEDTTWYKSLLRGKYDLKLGCLKINVLVPNKICFAEDC